MIEARARSVATFVFATVVVLSGLWVFLTIAYRATPRHPDEPTAAVGVVAIALALLFAAVGALIVRRHPRNSVGWIFCGLGLLYSSGLSLGGYAWISFSRGSSWPWTRAAGYLVDVTFQSPASFGLFVFFFLFFPDGRLPSRRWRLLALVAGLSILGLFVNSALRPDVLNTIPIQNPLGIEAIQPFREYLDVISFGSLVLSLFASVASLLVRLRRSWGDERQQLKWFLTAAVVLVTVIGIAPFTFFTPRFPTWVWPVVLVGSLSLIPIAAGVAILKYRLYEIDVIINRALVYAVLTAILAGAYLGIVVLLQRMIDPITADSDVAIAGSTLAVAALFRPLRTRVQSFIDRRFYRRKYDAAATLEAFSARLRDEVDLHSLSDELITLVASTMQPTHASLWLREAKT